jgi:hypothetical protein
VEGLLEQLPNSILPAGYSLAALTNRLHDELGGWQMPPVHLEASGSDRQTMIQ